MYWTMRTYTYNLFICKIMYHVNKVFDFWNFPCFFVLKFIFLQTRTARPPWDTRTRHRLKCLCGFVWNLHAAPIKHSAIAAAVQKTAAAKTRKFCEATAPMKINPGWWGGQWSWATEGRFDHSINSHGSYRTTKIFRHRYLSRAKSCCVQCVIELPATQGHSPQASSRIRKKRLRATAPRRCLEFSRSGSGHCPPGVAVIRDWHGLQTDLK